MELDNKEDPKQYREFLNRVTNITWGAIEKIQIQKNAKFQLKEYLNKKRTSVGEPFDDKCFKWALREWIKDEGGKRPTRPERYKHLNEDEKEALRMEETKV